MGGRKYKADPRRDGSILKPVEEKSSFRLSQKSYISSCLPKGTSPTVAFIVINWRERSSMTNKQESTFGGSKQLGQKYRCCRYEQGSGQEVKRLESCTRWNTCYLHSTESTTHSPSRRRLGHQVWSAPTVESTSRRYISDTKKPASGSSLTCTFCYFAGIQSCQTSTRVCCRTRHTVHWKASSSAVKRSSWPKDPPLSGNSRLHPTGRRECYSPHHNSHLSLFPHTGNPNIPEALGWDVRAVHTGCLGREQGTDNNSTEAENEGGSSHHSGRGHWHSLCWSGIPLPQPALGSSIADQKMCGCTARPSCISLAHKYCGCWTRILLQNNPRGKKGKWSGSILQHSQRWRQGVPRNLVLDSHFLMAPLVSSR